MTKTSIAELFTERFIAHVEGILESGKAPVATHAELARRAFNGYEDPGRKWRLIRAGKNRLYLADAFNIAACLDIDTSYLVHMAESDAKLRLRGYHPLTAPTTATPLAASSKADQNPAPNEPKNKD